MTETPLCIMKPRHRIDHFSFIYLNFFFVVMLKFLALMKAGFIAVSIDCTVPNEVAVI